jgi:hypothetical protein
VAGAQSVTDTSAPASARRLVANASALRPGQWVYQMTLERNGGTTQLGMRTVTAALTTYGGSPAWMIADAQVTDAIASTDTVFADATTLNALHWSSAIGAARLAAEFRGDTVYGATSAPAGRRSIVAMVPAGSILTGAMLETELRLLPLQTGWQDSATTVSITLNDNTVVPARLSVIGEDRPRTPAGTFDCWVVAVHADAGRGLYWVTKSNPIVVRSTIDVPTMGEGTQLVSVLTRVAR